MRMTDGWYYFVALGVSLMARPRAQPEGACALLRGFSVVLMTGFGLKTGCFCGRFNGEHRMKNCVGELFFTETNIVVKSIFVGVKNRQNAGCNLLRFSH